MNFFEISLIFISFFAITATQSTPRLPSTSVPNKTCTNATTSNSKGCPQNWTRFGDHCYMNADVYTNWTNAESYCVAQDAHLTSIWSMEENQFILSLLKFDDIINGHPVNGSYLDAWIGLQVNAVNWTDQSPVNFTNNAPDLFTKGNCTFMFPCGRTEVNRAVGDDLSGMWRGWYCDGMSLGIMRQAVCKKPANLTEPAKSAGMIPEFRAQWLLTIGVVFALATDLS